MVFVLPVCLFVCFFEAYFGWKCGLAPPPNQDTSMLSISAETLRTWSIRMEGSRRRRHPMARAVRRSRLAPRFPSRRRSSVLSPAERARPAPWPSGGLWRILSCAWLASSRALRTAGRSYRIRRIASKWDGVIRKVVVRVWKFISLLSHHKMPGSESLGPRPTKTGLRRVHKS